MRVRRQRQPPPQPTKLFDALPHQVHRVFDCMDVAERCIKAACVLWPDHYDRLQRSFLLLVPTEVMRGKDNAVYEAHCLELLERVANQQDTRPGTKAEVLCGLLEGALKAPPSADYCALTNRLFSEVMPGRLDLGHVAEQWPGQHQEMLTAARTMLRRDTRRVA